MNSLSRAACQALAGPLQPAAIGALWHCSTALSGFNRRFSGAPQPGTPNTEKPSTSTEKPSTSGQPSAEEIAQKLHGTFKTGFESVKAGFENVKSKVGGDAGAGASTSGDQSAGSSDSGSAAPKPSLFSTLLKDVKDVLSPRQDVTSATTMYQGPVAAASEGTYTGPTELVIIKRKKTKWEETMDGMKDKLRGIPVLNKLASAKIEDTRVYRKGAEFVEDLKDKYETMDNPAVHKVEEVKEKLFSGSESSRAMAAIRSRDPDFDINRFAMSIKLDAPKVTKAFLAHDMEALKLHCGPELLERFAGIFKHFSEQGVFEDPTILFVGDVEIVEVRMMDDDPFIIAQFHCQQLKCTRDKFGNVIEGSEDSIQRVFYFWGLQMEKLGVVTAEGELLPPRWVIKDMMWQSMLALV